MRKAPRRVPKFLGLTALWLILVGQLSWPEFCAGALAASLVTIASALSNGSVHPVFRTAWLTRAPGPMLRVFPDTAKVLWAVLQGCFGHPPRGRFVIVPTPDSPAERLDEARHGAHVLGISLPAGRRLQDLLRLGPSPGRGRGARRLERDPMGAVWVPASG